MKNLYLLLLFILTSTTNLPAADFDRSLLKTLKHDDNPIQEVAKLLKNGAHVNALDSKYRTPLHLAALHGYTSIVGLFIAQNATINSCDIWGNSPLHCAAANGRDEIAHLLLTFDADPHQTNHKGYDPAALAFQQGYITLAHFIRNWNHSSSSAKVETSYQASLKQGLLQAIKYDNFAQVDSCLSEPEVDINTPIFWNGLTALHLAVLHGQEDMTNHLLSKGADLNSLDAFNQKPIVLATKMRHFDIGLILVCSDPDQSSNAFYEFMTTDPDSNPKAFYEAMMAE